MRFILGSVQRLPNGNTLINDGYQMRVFEVTPNGLYLFHVDRYPADFPAFAGKDLSG